MGHPIHPILVPFPIGFFVGAFICDVIYVLRPTPFWPIMSLVLIGFGIIGALFAATFGLLDYFTVPMSRAARKTAIAHMAFNAVAVVVFAVAFFLRNGDTTSTTGYALTAVGVVILGIGGALGGHLTYHHRIGMEERGDERPASRQPTVTGSGSAWSSYNQ